jgi:hypothetical protein
MKRNYPAYVYIIKRAGDGCIKIGVARNPKKRLKQLQTGSNVELFIVGCFPYKSRMEAFEMERQLHERFAIFRQEGEWFSGGLLKKMFNDALLKKDTAKILKANIKYGRFSKKALIKSGILVEFKELGYTYEDDLNKQRGALIYKKLKNKREQKSGHEQVIAICKEHGIDVERTPDNVLINKLPQQVIENLPPILKKHVKQNDSKRSINEI